MLLPSLRALHVNVPESRRRGAGIPAGFRSRRLQVTLWSVVLAEICLSVAVSQIHAQSRSGAADGHVRQASQERDLHIDFKRQPLPFTTPIISAAYAPNGDLYLGTISATIYASHNLGATWTALPSLPQAFVEAMTIGASGELIAAYGSVLPSQPRAVPAVAVFRGSAWQQATGIRASRGITSLTLAPNGHDILAVTAWNGDVWRSRNNGASFTQEVANIYTKLVNRPGALWLVRSVGSVVYTGGEGGVLKSVDGGFTYSYIGPLSSHGNFNVLAVNRRGDPVCNRTLTTDGSPLLRCERGTWKIVHGLEPWTIVLGLTSDPQNSDSMFATDFDRGTKHTSLCISSDGGNVWRTVSTNLDRFLTPSAIQLRDPIVTRDHRMLIAAFPTPFLFISVKSLP
jgi:hypothetical protein